MEIIFITKHSSLSKKGTYNIVRKAVEEEWKILCAPKVILRFTLLF